MNIYLLALIIFTIAIVVIELIGYAFRTIRDPDRVRVRKKLRKLTYDPVVRKEGTQDIKRKIIFSEIPLLNLLLRGIPFMERLNRLRYQANATQPLGFFILLVPLLGMGAFLLFRIMGYGLHVTLPAGLLAAISPFFYLRRKRKKRMEKFVSQLPEALDLVARSLKVGHAFTAGMKLVADEFDDPVGPEFDVALDEINFGVPVADALRKMALRVDCPDLNFFVVAVILQRETGGNLALIIESIAMLIRERFKLFGKIRTLAAEGVLSMWVLIALPFGIAGVLTFMNPTYISLLFEETLGHIMIGMALVMMLIGYFFMRNIVKIKV